MKKVLPAWITCLTIFTINTHANGTGHTNVADTGACYYHAHHSLKSSCTPLRRKNRPTAR